MAVTAQGGVSVCTESNTVPIAEYAKNKRYTQTNKKYFKMLFYLLHAHTTIRHGIGDLMAQCMLFESRQINNRSQAHKRRLEAKKVGKRESTQQLCAVSAFVSHASPCQIGERRHT